MRKIPLLGEKERLSSVMFGRKNQSSGTIHEKGEDGCEHSLLSPWLCSTHPSPEQICFMNSAAWLIFHSTHNTRQGLFLLQKRNFPCHVLQLDIFFNVPFLPFTGTNGLQCSATLCFTEWSAWAALATMAALPVESLKWHGLSPLSLKGLRKFGILYCLI